jgi:anaerobic magnesium-protoporphyrin IX monomethyl ester cyclase
MKVMLVFPPQWTPAMPHLALPALTSYLRAHGVQVIQRDANLDLYDSVLTRRYVEQAVAHLRQDYGAHANRTPLRRSLPGRERVQWALAHGAEIASRVEAAVTVMRSPAFLSAPAGKNALETVGASLEIASLPFFPSSLQLTTYVPPSHVDRSRSLLQAARDAQSNMFLAFYRQGILAEIQRERPDIVGISIPTMEQMLSGMTLAALIKDAGLSCHVTIGGPHISMLREQLPRVAGVFDLIDSAVIFDGEEPLLKLAEALDGDGDLSTVPSLIYRDGDQMRATAYEQPEKVAELPMPDFDGLPVGRYLAPAPALPLLSARGCYHGKCAFCNVGYGGFNLYRQLPAERVVEQMMALHSTYGVRHIFFADEAMSPRNLRDMSALLEAQGSPIHWCGCVRFEKALTDELLQNMARGGCQMLLFGLETASEPIMRRMVKGTQRQTMGRILDQGAQAGIWNHTFFFFGFPGETMEDAQETVNFVYEHQQGIHSASVGTFLLERYAPAFLSPEKYGITSIVDNPAGDLAIYFDYTVAQGLDEKTADLVASRFVDVLPEKRFGHVYLNDVYRLIYASHLREQGSALPLWLVGEEQGPT